jgi:hypothetical protein
MNLTKEQLEWCEKHLTRNKWKVNSEGRVDVEDHVDLDIQIYRERDYKKIPVPFGIVEGFFSCSGWPNLVSLENSPIGVWGGFYCSDCTSLKTLEGAPLNIQGVIHIENCPALDPLHKEIANDYNDGKIDWETAHRFIHRPKLAQAHSLGLI